MDALLERPDTVVPSDEDSKLAAETSRALAKNRESELRVQLDNGETLVLPKAVRGLLTHLLTEMGQGNAVTVVPFHAELTTQEAADYLKVSRPYLVRLLEEERIPFHKVGTHRRVQFRHLIAFKEAMHRRSRKARDDLADQAQELDMGY